MAEQPGVVRVRETRALIAAALGGASAPAADAPGAAVVEVATAEGVASLLAARATCEQLGTTACAALRTARAGAAALALARVRELRHILEACAAAEVAPLLIKGAHLAHAIYPSPELRPHGDLDLLIDERDRGAAGAALEAAGYRRLVHVAGVVAFTQVHYWRDDACGVRHFVDLHWRICEPVALRDRLTWDELKAARTPIPGLCAAAWGPSPPHALAIAAIHRTAHHGNTDRLIWLYDVHLLAGTLTPVGWNALASLAEERRIAPLIEDALDATSRWFATRVPADVRLRLAAANAGADPAARAFLDPDRRPVDTLLSDWKGLVGWRPRWRFLVEHLLPDPDYIAQRYGTASRLALPILYARRVLTGWRRWL